MTLHLPSDSIVASSVRDLVDDLRKGVFGLRPSLKADAQRLKVLANFFSLKQINVKRIDAERVLMAYADYLDELAKQQRLISELSSALGRFMDGYPVDARICNVPMLNKLMPEFMEGVRTIGGIGFGSVPSRLGFSRMRVGPHSTCIGLIGLWSSLIAIQRRERQRLEYYIFPDLFLQLRYGGVRARDVTDQHKIIVGGLRGCTPSNIAAQALFVSLQAAASPHRLTGYRSAVIGQGARRSDLYEQDLPLDIENLRCFADELVLLEQSAKRRTHRRLQNLLRAALSEPRGRDEREERLSRQLHNAGIRIAQLIFMALTHSIGTEQLAYEAARLMYAHTDVEFERWARQRGALLEPSDLPLIVRAIESCLKRLP
jgi:hypothetical protein